MRGRRLCGFDPFRPSAEVGARRKAILIRHDQRLHLASKNVRANGRGAAYGGFTSLRYGACCACRAKRRDQRPRHLTRLQRAF